VLRFVVRRVLISIPVVILASFFVFFLVSVSGDPLEDLRLRPGVKPEMIEQRERELGLDKPIPVRYVNWATDFVTGDWGKDQKGRDVQDQLVRSLGVTARLVIAATVISILLGVTVGVISAIRQYRLFDYTSTGLAFLFYAMPVFWFAVLLKEFGAIRFNNQLESWGYDRWVATVGQQTPNFEGTFWARLGDYAGHMILPLVTLSIIGFAAYSRFMRSSMLDTLSADYVRTARAKGLPERRVVMKHAFRNALIPVTTFIALDFGAVLGGAIITENVFAWQGMGTLFRRGLIDADVNVVQAWFMVIAITVIVANIVADIAYAFLDPRIRLES
jgi:peptide/nickel transport system permease protein